MNRWNHLGPQYVKRLWLLIKSISIPIHKFVAKRSTQFLLVFTRMVKTLRTMLQQVIPLVERVNHDDQIYILIEKIHFTFENILLQIKCWKPLEWRFSPSTRGMTCWSIVLNFHTILVKTRRNWEDLLAKKLWMGMKILLIINHKRFTYCGPRWFHRFTGKYLTY